jgi:CHASE2 domain-containing sensor protein
MGPVASKRASGRVKALCVSAAVAVVVGVCLQLTGALRGPELDSLDLRFAIRGADPPSEFVVVAVDDVTFSEMGRSWPFPRSRFGEAVKRLHAAGAREIVLDIQFTEPTKPREDLALYRAIGRAGGAVLATSETDGHGRTRVLGGDENLARIDAEAGAANLPEDEGGVLRRFRFSEGGLESLAVKVARRLGHDLDRADFEDGEALIDFRGGPGTVPTVSFSRLLQDRVDPSVLRDRIVVLGTSAPTLHDVHPTAASGDDLMAGPEVQANAIWTALHDLPLGYTPQVLAFLAIVLLALAAPAAALRMPAPPAAALGLALGASYLAVAQLAFQAGHVLELATPLATLGLSIVLTIASSYLAEARDRRLISLYSERLEREVQERTRELRETEAEIVTRLGRAVEWRDEETGEHIARLSRLCRRLGRAAGMSLRESDLLGRASVMHDVGKIGVPDRILRKPGPLDDDEWTIMRDHTTIGSGILSGSRSPLVQMAESIARTHHERWDGSGYPEGLAGEQIPLVGRIVAICDVFDALVSERPYKRAWPFEEAIAEIEAQAGRHFDPELVPLFVQMIRAERGQPERDGSGEVHTRSSELSGSLQQ